MADYVEYFGKLRKAATPAATSSAYAVLLQVSRQSPASAGRAQPGRQIPRGGLGQPGHHCQLAQGHRRRQADEFALQIKQFWPTNARGQRSRRLRRQTHRPGSAGQGETGPTVGTMKYDDVLAAVHEGKRRRRARQPAVPQAGLHSCATPFRSSTRPRARRFMKLAAVINATS